jgi:enoyl-CoA hydratase
VNAPANPSLTQSSAPLAVERDGRIAIATLGRAPVNALDDDLVARLEALVDALAADPDVTLLHLRSSQRAFCAGADLALMESCLATASGVDAMIELVRRMQRVFARIESAPFVSLAEIGGAALGGGLELALACDLRVAADEAVLGLPEAGLGLLPAAGGTQRLTRLAGAAVAKRLILGAETIDGAEAARLGVVQWSSPRDELAPRTRALAQRIAGLPRAALSAGKGCIHAAGDASRDDGYAAEIAGTRTLYENADTRARVAKFLAARAKPPQTREKP